MTALDLSALNEPQREAVEHAAGPLLVFAGAGSGKTRVLTYRLAHLIDRGLAAPHQILAVTFTNKAAGEMKRRVGELLGGRGGETWVHTFHAASLRILRREAPHLGMERSFVIYDERDQIELIKAVLKELDPSRRESPSRVRACIEAAKRSGVRAEDYVRERPLGTTGLVARAYLEYDRRMRQSGAVDFSDLLALTVRLFEEHEDVLARYRERFHHLLVDEFQDTDHQQYRLVRMLAAPRDNLCVVGDDDQSIYSFRGALVENIRGFADDYPEAKVVRLEQNYRSTTAILDSASRVVTRGGGGAESKQLWTARAEGRAPGLVVASDEADEARRAAEKVARVLAAGTPAHEAAVLYRTNAQSRALEEAFLRADIPFVLVGGMRFYERREIKEALSYLRLLINPHDRIAFARAVRAPARGIGAQTVAKVLAIAAERGGTIERALAAAAGEGRVGKALATRLTRFAELIAALRREAEGQPAADVVALVLKRSGLLDAYAGDESHEGQQRQENLQELVRAFAEQPLPPGLGGVAEMLDRTALVADVDDLGEGTGTGGAAGGAGDGGRVSLMTIHAAKGLEFSLVVLVGLDEGIFPNSRAAVNRAGLEEEYRLCYVALTRAKDELVLSRARRRMLIVERGGRSFQTWQNTRPSPFLADLVGERAVRAPALRPSFGSRRSFHAPRHAPPRPPEPKPMAAPPEVEGDTVVVYEEVDEVTPRPGTRVRHPRFGEGEIRRVEGTGHSMKFTVFFPRAGLKKLVARWANLQIIG